MNFFSSLELTFLPALELLYPLSRNFESIQQKKDYFDIGTQQIKVLDELRFSYRSIYHVSRQRILWQKGKKGSQSPREQERNLPFLTPPHYQRSKTQINGVKIFQNSHFATLYCWYNFDSSTPSPWLTRIRFTRISLTRIFKKFPFLT